MSYGLCECGCGGRTTVASKTDRKYGYVKGKPKRFVRGHATKGARFFWPKVNKDAPNGCWEWTGWTDRLGYGHFGKPTKRVHRYAWELTNGPIPEGKVVCHHCDNRRCVNPDHLFVGTQAENIQDCISKGRFVIGAKHGRTKLSDVQVREVRSLFDRGWRQQDIADAYGVSQALVSGIGLRQQRLHVSEAV